MSTALDQQREGQEGVLLKKLGLGAAIGLFTGTVAATSLAVCAGVGYEVLTHESDNSEALPQVPVSRREAARQSRAPHAPSTPRSTASSSRPTASSAVPAQVPTPTLTPTVLPDTLPASITASLAEKIRARLEQLDAADGFDGPLFLGMQESGLPDGRDQYIGTPGLKIVPYQEVADLAKPGEYLTFLIDTMDSPQDAAELTHPFFLRPGDSTQYPGFPQDIIQREQGDCDDYSILTQLALSRLGQRKGVDYHPRVIGEVPKGTTVGHAVTIYDENGVPFTIDQNLPRPFHGISEASSFFPRVDRAHWIEITVATPNRSYRLPISGGTLQPDYRKEMVARLNGETYAGEGFDFSSLPSGWDHYSGGLLCFAPDADAECAQMVILQDGKLNQVSYETGALAWQKYDRNGKLEAEIFRSGSTRVIEYRDGQKVNVVPF